MLATSSMQFHNLQPKQNEHFIKYKNISTLGFLERPIICIKLNEQIQAFKIKKF